MRDGGRRGYIFKEREGENVSVRVRVKGLEMDRE